MNKTIIININSIVFHIEEDAYETLRAYMIDIKRHFSQSLDSNEILLDIENRIAEMFSEKIQAGKKEVLTIDDVNEVISQMGRVSDFEEVEEVEGAKQNTNSQDNSAKEDFKKDTLDKKLMRNPDDKVISGVCSGLGYYFGLSPKWVRLAFVLFFLFGGSGVLLYVVLWAVMPKAKTRAEKMAMRGEEINLQNFKRDFDLELGNYKEGFDKAKGHLVNGTKAVRSGLGGFFNIIGKAFAFIMLIILGMTLLGIFGGFIGFSSGILGYQSAMVFPGTTVFPIGQALIALAAGALAIGIPFVALFYIFFRILFKTGPMNNYLSLSLWAGWLVSVITVIFFVFVGIQAFKEESTIKIERTLTKREVYHFGQNDSRTIDGANYLKEKKGKSKIVINGEELSSYLRNNINITFESIDESETGYIQYNYSAKGRSRKLAAEYASAIKYEAVENDNKISFASHFSLPSDDIYRHQAVSVIVYLPVGSKIIIDKSLEYKTWGLPMYDCFGYYDEQNLKQSEWIMKKSGLQCAPNYEIIKEKKDEDE